MSEFYGTLGYPGEGLASSFSGQHDDKKEKKDQYTLEKKDQCTLERKAQQLESEQRELQKLLAAKKKLRPPEGLLQRAALGGATVGRTRG